jgi:lysophospholipase L1-like esterase
MKGVMALITIVILVLVEIVCSFFYIHSPPKLNYDRASLFENNPEIFEVSEKNGQPAFKIKYFPTIYYEEANNKVVSHIYARKAANVFRVFFYGGSSMAGSPFGPWGSFPRFLTEKLNEIKKTNVELELINFGASSYGTTRISQLVAKTIDWKPDLIIVYTGENEVHDASLHLDKIHNAPLNFLMQHSYFVKLFYSKVIPSFNIGKDNNFLFVTSEEMTPFSKKEKLFLDAVYEKNINFIVSLANEKDIPILLTSPISNHVEAPIIYEPIPIHKEIEKEILSAIHTENKNLKHKILAWVSQYPTDATVNYYAGLYFAFLGDKFYSKKHLENSIEYDDYPRRSKPSYANILKHLSTSLRNVYYLDLKTNIEKSLDDHIFDGRLLMDTMHPNIAGYLSITNEVLKSFFFKHRFREDLFSYSSQFTPLPLTLPEDDPSLQFYSFVCERYTTSIYKPHECAEDFLKRFNLATRYDEKRSAKRAWEMLYYIGIVGKNDKLITNAKNIYWPENEK